MREHSAGGLEDHELITLLAALYQVGIRMVSVHELRSSLVLPQEDLLPVLEKLCKSEYLSPAPDDPREGLRYWLLDKCKAQQLPLGPPGQVEAPEPR